jgi:Domain of unknown function (DUF4153)
MLLSNSPLEGRAALIFCVIVGAVIGLALPALDFTGGSGSELGIQLYRNVATASLFFVAFVLWAGSGTMRPKTLGVWAIIVATVIAFIFWHSQKVFGGRGLEWGNGTIFALPLVFIAHELVSSGDQAKRIIAPYETYFDEAWKRGVQLALALLFTGLFFAILALGSALLGFIGFDWLKKLMDNEYFTSPVCGMAFGAAVHLADATPKILNNVRNLALGVLSWLLPVISLIGAVFAVSLLFSGLAPLWATKAATATLLGACVAFVLLINAAYQIGESERAIPVVLKYCVRLCALLLLIFAVLAAWSLLLRISQYGLTSERIFAGLGVVIALAFGIGYSFAIFAPGRWMAKIEPVNVGMAIIKCALFLAIITPLASPARLSVDDQINRLTAGKVSIDKFDWWLLANETGTYGKKGLERLAASSNPLIVAKAKEALDGKLGQRPYRDRPDGEGLRVATRADRAAIPVMFPKNAKLPDSFLDADFINTDPNRTEAPECLRYVGPPETSRPCKIALIDVNGDKVPEVLVYNDMYTDLVVMLETGSKWRAIGYYGLLGDAKIFESGNISVKPSQWRDLQVGEKRLTIKVYNDAQTDEVINSMPPAPKTLPSETLPSKTAPPPSK